MRLIDADALIHRICEERDGVKIEHACDIGYHNGLNMAASMAINAPTIEARPVVRGEWKGDGMYMTCPNCGAMFDEDDLINSILLFKKTGYDKSACNFCGNCGADMRAREDENG